MTLASQACPLDVMLPCLKMMFVFFPVLRQGFKSSNVEPITKNLMCEMQDLYFMIFCFVSFPSRSTVS
jgi:hypothetical protein